MGFEPIGLLRRISRRSTSTFYPNAPDFAWRDSLVPIRGFKKGTDKFPIQKCAIFRKFKEIKELRGGILLYAAQAIPPIDAEIAEKGHLWTENR
jgi:hypothetical protein